MNISTPVDNKIKRDLVIDDGEIIKKSLVVAKKLDVYLDDLKVVIKSNFKHLKRRQQVSKQITWARMGSNIR